MTDHIQTEINDKIITITIDRQAQKNALTHEMYAAIADGLEQLDRDDSLRAGMITGAGDVFTAGNDLMDFAGGLPEGKPPVFRFLDNIRDCSKPVIAAVNGPAVGVGLTMLLHCDLSFAAQSATFRAPFPMLGLVPEAASSMLLPLTVGTAMANDVFLGGRVLTADEALQAGLISRIFPNADLLNETSKVVAHIASQAPNAIKKTKHLVRSNKEEIKTRMGEENVLFAEQLKSPEFAEAAAAFMQKRAPKFD